MMFVSPCFKILFIDSLLQGPISDMLWSDPDDPDGFSISVRFVSSLYCFISHSFVRGAGFLFGKDVTNKFLQTNKMTLIVRSHQLCHQGYNVCSFLRLTHSFLSIQMKFSNQLVTVWSAPDYCYRMKNVASVLEIDDNLNMFFNTFYKSPFEERTKVQKAYSERSQEPEPFYLRPN